MVVRQLLDSHQAVVRQSPGSRQAVARLSPGRPGSGQAAARQSSESRQAVIRYLSGRYHKNIRFVIFIYFEMKALFLVLIFNFVYKYQEL